MNCTDWTVNLNRTFKAPVSKVFDAWKDPGFLTRWWNNLNVAELDFRVGGNYRFEWQGWDGYVEGRYLEIEHNKVIVFTWEPKFDGKAQEPSQVSLRFEDLGGETRLTLLHQFNPDEATRDQHEKGWTNALDCLLEEFAGAFTLEVTVDASREKVYESLTTVEGLSNWWTQDCRRDKEGRLRFAFGQTFNLMEVESVEPGVRVSWRCVDQDHVGQQNPREWVGTRLDFQLSETSGGTLIQFAHHGLTPNLECYEVCEMGWTHFLATSLKSALESGTGQPFTGD